MKRRVVVSGMGMVTPAGIGLEPNWQNVVEGKSMALPVNDLPVSVAAQIRDFRPEEYIKDRRILRFLPPEDGYGIASAKMALEDAGFKAGEVDLGEGGVYLGSSKEITWPDWIFSALPESTDEDESVYTRKFGTQCE